MLLWLVKNPIKSLCVLLALVFAFQWWNIDRLSRQNKELKTAVELSEANLKKTNDNIERIDLIQQEMQKTKDTQVIIRERIRDVPVKAEDRPFVNDPGLLNRIDIMRQHQESVQ